MPHTLVDAATMPLVLLVGCPVDAATKPPVVPAVAVAALPVAPMGTPAMWPQRPPVVVIVVPLVSACLVC